MARNMSLRSGERALRENVPIHFNDWTSVSLSQAKEEQPKSSLVKFSVLTNNHGVGGRANKSDCSYGSKTALKLGRIEDNPRAIIETWQIIFT